MNLRIKIVRRAIAGATIEALASDLNVAAANEPMIVEIFLVVDEHPEVPWSGERVQGRCPFFNLEAESSDEDVVREHLKGAALIALGHQTYVPSKIEFRISRKLKEKA